MPEPHRRYSSSDVPEFASYPASAEDAIGRARLRELPIAGLDLDSAARRIGEALGRAASVARDTRDRVLDAKDEALDLVDAASYRLRSQVSEAAENYAQLAQEKIGEARYRTQHFAKTATRDYPVHLILGAAATGLLLGAGLRAWRENRG